MTTVHFVVPDGIDDPERPSGGNAYDRQVRGGLRSLGLTVCEHAVGGGWPRPDAASFAGLADTVERIPDGSVVLIDGLVASTAPDVLVPHARRLRLVVLVHMPLGTRAGDELPDETRRRERAVLSAAAAVITTSVWSRDQLLELYRLLRDRVHVAEPGVETADLAPGTLHGGELLCVAAVTFDKGHDILVDALAPISDLSWRCVCVGNLNRDPEFVEELRRRTLEDGLGDRLQFVGTRDAAELDRTYAAADLMVLPSRAETYGMVVTEALARGLPVVAADVGGLMEALGHGDHGTRPGMLFPAGDAHALGVALRAWLGAPELRDRLRRAARKRRESLRPWSTTVSSVAGVLAAVSQ